MARMRLKVSITHYPLGEGGQDTPLHSVLNFQSRYMSGSSPVYIPHLFIANAGETKITEVEPYNAKDFYRAMSGDRLYIIGFDRTINGEATIMEVRR